MSRFIQPLENRTLLSASAATLDADLAAITTAGTPIKADLTAIQTAAKTDDVKLVTDLKGTPKTNLPLLKKLIVDEAALLKLVKADAAALLKSTPVATKSVADGKAIIANPALTGGGTKIQADVTKLSTGGTNPLAKLTTDSATTKVDADIDAIVAANASVANVSADGAAAKNNFHNAVNALLSHATIYSQTVGVLNTDMTTLLPGPAVPLSLVGDYKGTLTTKGVVFGIGAQTFPLEIIITDQTDTTLTGTITADNNTAHGTIDYTQLPNGNVTLKLNNSSATISLTGKINIKTTKKGLPPGSVISGSGTITIDGVDIKGDFSVTRIT